jgi:hypothetical protein
VRLEADLYVGNPAGWLPNNLYGNLVRHLTLRVAGSWWVEQLQVEKGKVKPERGSFGA